jgi:hypothetical protein
LFGIEKFSELFVRRTTECASAQFLGFLDLAKTISFLEGNERYWRVIMYRCGLGVRIII